MAVAGGLFTAIGTATFFRDNFLRPDMRARLDTFALLPHWSCSTWAFLALGVLLLGALEGSYRLDQRRQREIVAVRDEVERRLGQAESELSRFLDLTPRIHGLSLSSDPRIGQPGEFDLHVDITTSEPTSFNDDWRLDLRWPTGERVDGLPGRVAIAHAFPVGRMPLTLSFPYTEIAGGVSVIRDAVLERLTGTDHRGRTIEFPARADQGYGREVG